jgi:Uma2 family endonuclease
VGMAQRVLRGPFTVDVYQRLGELGVLGADARVELVDGQVVEMTPIGDRHASVVRRLIHLFARTLIDLALFDVQNPVVLGERDAPQPDLTLLKPPSRPDGYRHHPRARDILMVVEVADTTLASDSDVKIPLYARAGIPEAWLVDVVGERVLVYQEPAGGRYTSVRAFSHGARIALRCFPRITFLVDDILG